MQDTVLSAGRMRPSGETSTLMGNRNAVSECEHREGVSESAWESEGCLEDDDAALH